MFNYGIRGIANDFFYNYLSDRHQLVEDDERVSDTVPIRIKVPERSILGPLLYLIISKFQENQIHFIET